MISRLRSLKGPYIRAKDLSFGVPESARRALSDGGIESLRLVRGAESPERPARGGSVLAVCPDRETESRGVRGAEPCERRAGEDIESIFLFQN